MAPPRRGVASQTNAGKRLLGLINDMRLVVIEGSPHAVTWTHADQVNRALLGFLD